MSRGATDARPAAAALLCLLPLELTAGVGETTPRIAPQQGEGEDAQPCSLPLQVPLVRPSAPRPPAPGRPSHMRSHRNTPPTSPSAGAEPLSPRWAGSAELLRRVGSFP